MGHTGNCAGRLESQKELVQPFHVAARREYTLEFWAKNISGLVAPGRLMAQILNADGTTLAELKPTLQTGGAGSQGFQAYQLPFIGPNDGGGLTLRFTNVQSGLSMVAVDDVRLLAATPGSPPGLESPRLKEHGIQRLTWPEPSVGYRLMYAEHFDGPWGLPPQYYQVSPVAGIRREGDRLYLDVSPLNSSTTGYFRFVPE